MSIEIIASKREITVPESTTLDTSYINKYTPNQRAIALTQTKKSKAVTAQQTAAISAQRTQRDKDAYEAQKHVGKMSADLQVVRSTVSVNADVQTAAGAEKKPSLFRFASFTASTSTFVNQQANADLAKAQARLHEQQQTEDALTSQLP